MAAVSPADDDKVPVEPGTVSKALLSDLRRRGLEELLGLLCFMKVRSRAAFAELHDLSFRQISSTAKFADISLGFLAELRALRLELAQKAMAAADAASTSVRGEVVEIALLTICARVNRKLAVDIYFFETMQPESD